MKFLQDIRNRIGYRLLCRKAPKVSRHKTFNNLDTAQNIGVFFSLSHQDDLGTVRAFLSRMSDLGKQAEALGMREPAINHAEASDSAGISSFTLEKLSLWGYPKSIAAVSAFVSKQFDMLINLCPEENLCVDYVMATSKARFKVSPQLSSNDFADFILRLSDKSAICAQTILCRVEEYLSSISKP